jgi:hypothetical protein
LFLVFNRVMKLDKPPFVVKATVELGYSESIILRSASFYWRARFSS